MAQIISSRDDHSRMHEHFREDCIRVVNCKHCDAEVELINGWLNICIKCGTEYNGWGQELAPREQWGWEMEELF